MQSGGDVDISPYNIRIQLPNEQEDYTGTFGLMSPYTSDEELEEDDQEDVPDRDAVKKYSALMLEKANKKQRKQRKRKQAAAGEKGGAPKENPKGAVSRGNRPAVD